MWHGLHESTNVICISQSTGFSIGKHSFSRHVLFESVLRKYSLEVNFKQHDNLNVLQSDQPKDQISAYRLKTYR